MEYNFENLDSMRSDALKLKEIFERLEPKIQFLAGVPKNGPTPEMTTAAFESLVKTLNSLSASPAVLFLLSMTLLKVYNHAFIDVLESRIKKLGRSTIPKIENPCKICLGVGHTQGIFSEPGVLQQCLRCEGTGQEPADIKSREISIIITSFFAPKVDGWVSSLEANSECKAVSPETIIDIIQGVVNMLQNKQFMTPRSGGTIQ